MSKKHPVKSTQSSARTNATTARPDQRTRPVTQAGSSSSAGDAATTGDAGLCDITSAEARAQMIAEAAYYLSEQRGFAPGHEVEDWLAAEQQIDSRIEVGRGVMGPMQIS